MVLSGFFLRVLSPPGFYTLSLHDALPIFFVFRAGHSPRTLVYASFGAAVMGMWSSVSTSAGSAMQRERWWGTLELLVAARSEEHTSELQSRFDLVCRLLLEKKKNIYEYAL